MRELRFRQLWEELRLNERLSDFVDVRRGFKTLDGSLREESIDRWYGKAVIGSNGADTMRQFEGELDCLADVGLFQVPHALDYPGPDWHLPKVLMPRYVESESWWPCRARANKNELFATHHFVALFPKSIDMPIEALEAILNSPVANAYLREFSPSQISIRALNSLPIGPDKDFSSLVRRVRDFHAKQRQFEISRSGDQWREQLADALVRVDAEVLRLYRLDPKLEHDLLSFLENECPDRRVGFDFGGWYGQFKGTISLHERVSLIDARRQDTSHEFVLEEDEPELFERPWYAFGSWGLRALLSGRGVTLYVRK
jgi:hypothetical protein